MRQPMITPVSLQKMAISNYLCWIRFPKLEVVQEQSNPDGHTEPDRSVSFIILNQFILLMAPLLL
jgi:hypothetical protein